MPVIALDPGAAGSGLSPRARELWLKSQSYRRLTDDIAAGAKPARVAAGESQ